MVDGLCLQLFSFFYIIILAFAYFSKKRIKNNETKIYSLLIITNIIGLLIHFIFIYAIKYKSATSFLTIFATRGYLIYLLTWLTLFTFYVFEISFKKDKWFSDFLKKVSFCIYIIFFILLIFLPLNIYYDGIKMYTYGLSVEIVYINAFVYFSIWIICLFKDFKVFKSRKNMLILFLLFIGFITMAIQYIFPYLLLMTALESFVTVIMYFTIENPDVKLMEEFHDAKVNAENSQKEKTMFLFNMSQQIRTPLIKIQNQCRDIWIEDDITAIKKETKNIDLGIQEIIDGLNLGTDLSSIKLKKIKIYNTRYDIQLLMKQIIQMYKGKIEQKGIDFRYSIDKDIPKFLYGDFIRLKQVICNLLDNAIKYTENGFIEFDIKSIIKFDVCRLIIIVEDSGCGINSKELNKIFSVSTEKKEFDINEQNKDLVSTQKLISSMCGLIVPQSEIGKGTKYSIVLDQQICEVTKYKELNRIEKMDKKYLEKKEILLISENDEEKRKILKKFSKYNCVITNVKWAAEGIGKIREGKKYKAIIMDEEMSKLSPSQTYTRLKNIDNFNIPVVLISADKKRRFMEGEFKYVLTKPLVSKEIKSLYEKIIESE